MSKINQQIDFDEVKVRLLTEKPHSLGAFVRLFWELRENNECLLAEDYVSVIDALGLKVRVVDSVKSAAASGLSSVLQERLNELKFNDDFENAFARRPTFRDSEVYSYVEKFVERYSDSFPSDELYKLQSLLEGKGYGLSTGELVFFVDHESKRQNDEHVRNLILSHSPRTRRQFFEAYLCHFTADDDVSLEALLSTFISLGIQYGDLRQVKEHLFIVEKEIELKVFEERLISGSRQMSVVEIDNLDGYEFEQFLRELFSKMGFTVEHTRLSGDQGADLVVAKCGERTVVQAKCYSGNVGNYAVQEIFAARNLYGAQRGMVVTNSYFTKAAVELATANNVELVDREDLEKLIRKHW